MAESMVGCQQFRSILAWKTTPLKSAVAASKMRLDHASDKPVSKAEGLRHKPATVWANGFFKR